MLKMGPGLAEGTDAFVHLGALLRRGQQRGYGPAATGI